MEAKFPAPWDLEGKGYIILYKFKRSFVEKNGCVPPFLKNQFAGGFGSVMLVNYEKSNAGPYGELLFIPGKFRYAGRKKDTISKIYVSTMESVVNGRANWGIPKEKAEFSFEKVNEREEKITVNVAGQKALECVIGAGRMAFPISTKLLPFPLVQEWEGKRYFTSFFGKGRGHFAHIRSITVNSRLFPDISGCRPIAVIRVDPFAITFPKAGIEE